MGYLAHTWYENLKVAELRFNLAYYRQEVKRQVTLKDIQQQLKMIEKADQEFKELTQGKYEHLIKADNDYSNCNSKDCKQHERSSEDTDEVECI